MMDPRKKKQRDVYSVKRNFQEEAPKDHATQQHKSTAHARAVTRQVKLTKFTDLAE